MVAFQGYENGLHVEPQRNALETMPKKRNRFQEADEFRIASEQQYDVRYKATQEQYEYLKRRARKVGHEIIKWAINEKVFKPNWRTELNLLREEQRKASIPDETFFHPQFKKKLGLDKKTKVKLKAA